MVAITWLFYGALAGIGVAIILYVLGGALELLNCTCNIVSCNLDGGDAIPGMWEGSTFFTVLLFCVIICAVIGLIYGLCKMRSEATQAEAKKKAENSEQARLQRVAWANEIKDNATYVVDRCKSNLEHSHSIVFAEYCANDQLHSILKELANLAELEGKVEAMANKIEKGGR